MQTFNGMSEFELNQVQGGGDTFSRDMGQFFGGAGGWARANLRTYVLMGPLLGGGMAIYHGFQEAMR